MLVKTIILARRSCWWFGFARSVCRGEVRKQRVILDYLDCRGAKFVNCDLVYAGGPSTNLADCMIVNCRFEFVGAAVSTVLLLKGLERSGAGEVVDRLLRRPSKH